MDNSLLFEPDESVDASQEYEITVIIRDDNPVKIMRSTYTLKVKVKDPKA